MTKLQSLPSTSVDRLYLHSFLSASLCVPVCLGHNFRTTGARTSFSAYRYIFTVSGVKVEQQGEDQTNGKCHM